MLQKLKQRIPLWWCNTQWMTTRGHCWVTALVYLTYSNWLCISCCATKCLDYWNKISYINHKTISCKTIWSECPKAIWKCRIIDSCDAFLTVMVTYLYCILQTLEARLGSLLKLLCASAEVFHLLDPPLRLQNFPQLPLPLPHGLQVAMETPTLPQQCLSW